MEQIKNILPNKCSNKTLVVFDTIVNSNYFEVERSNNRNDEIRIIHSDKLELLKGCMIFLQAFYLLTKKIKLNVKDIYILD